MLRRFLSDASLYAASAIVSRGIGLLMLPVYTRYLSPFEYGMMEMLVLAFALLNLLLPLEVSQAVARLMPEAGSPRDRGGYASTAFWFTVAGFLMLSLVVWAAPGVTARLLFGDAGHETVARFGAIAITGNALVYVLQNQLRWNLQPRAAVTVPLLHAGLLASISTVLIVGFEAGVMGYVWGQIAGSFAAVGAGLALTRVPVTAAPDADKLREMLRFSVPLVVSGAAVYLMQYVDRWMIGAWLALSDVGIYGAAARIAGAMTLLATGFQMALVPLIYQHHRHADVSAFIGRVLSWYMACAGALVGFIAAFSGELVGLLLGRGFDSAAALLVWLAIAHLALSLYFFAPGMSLAKKTGLIAAVNLAAACVNIVLNAIWIPRMGALGAAWATLAGGVTMAALYFLFSRRYYAVSYRGGRIAAGILLLCPHVGFMLTMSWSAPVRLTSWALSTALAAAVLIGWPTRGEPSARLLPGR